MDPERRHDDAPDSGATSQREREAERAPADPGPEHDPTTAREAFEREMAERDRTDEASRHGDHIE
jgi:hypothetical protein